MSTLASSGPCGPSWICWDHLQQTQTYSMKEESKTRCLGCFSLVIQPSMIWWSIYWDQTSCHLLKKCALKSKRSKGHTICFKERSLFLLQIKQRPLLSHIRLSTRRRRGDDSGVSTAKGRDIPRRSVGIFTHTSNLPRGDWDIAWGGWDMDWSMRWLSYDMRWLSYDGWVMTWSGWVTTWVMTWGGWVTIWGG